MAIGYVTADAGRLAILFWYGCFYLLICPFLRPNIKGCLPL